MTDLPLTLRPRMARVVLFPLIGVVLAAFGAAAALLPGEGTGGFGLADRAGIVLVGLAIAWVMVRIATVRIACSQSGVRVVNVLRERRLDWAEVVAVRLDPAAPWLLLDLADGTALPAMGVQGSDGEHAKAQMRLLARLVAEHTRTTRDD